MKLKQNKTIKPTNTVTPTERTKPNTRSSTPRKPSFKKEVTVSAFEERIVKLNGFQTTKGGRMMRFSALVVIGR